MSETETGAPARSTTKPNYGIDALPVVRNLAVIGTLCLILSIVCFTFGRENFLNNLKFGFLTVGSVLLLEAVLMTLYAKFGKYRHRDRMLDLVSWTGGEAVLDVGTGRGLLMIGAAKRLTDGKATGIDIWNEADLSGNRIENTLDNAALEGVSEKIEVLEQDARSMTFPDETFDVILSNLCLHNIASKDERKKACMEIARVLKTGGVAIISDFKSTGLYEQTFAVAGLKVEYRPLNFIDCFPPLRVLRVVK